MALVPLVFSNLPRYRNELPDMNPPGNQFIEVEQESDSEESNIDDLELNDLDAVILAELFNAQPVDENDNEIPNEIQDLIR